MFQRLSKESFLITGATGQDGILLAKKVLEFGYKAICIVRSESNIDFINQLFSNDNKFRIESANLSDSKSVDQIIKTNKPNYLVHLGSQSNVRDSLNLSSQTIESNFDSTVNLINSISKYSKETKFFFPSSATIYEGYKSTTVNESTIPRPKSVYANSKFRTQEFLREVYETSDLDLNLGIMFSHESEYRRSKFFSKKVIEFLVKFKNGSKRNLELGNLNIKRDIGYAKDYIDAIYLMLSNKSDFDYIVSSNKLYELSRFVEASMDYLEKNMKKITKKRVSVILM